MRSFQTYHSTAGESPLMRRWLLRALFASIVIHFLLFAYFRATKLERFGDVTTERLVPRPFINGGRVQIDEKLLLTEPEKTVPKKVTPDAVSVALPSETSFEKLSEEILVSVVSPDMPKPIVNDVIDPEGADWQAKAKALQNGSDGMSADSKSLVDQLLKDSQKATSKSLITFTEGRKTKEAGGGSTERPGSGAIPGTSTVEDMLAQSGPVVKGKIGMPGGALYEYDSAELKSQAIEQLKKLGQIIQRSPHALFSIEGHSDSFGSESPEGELHNQVLSLARAQSVKEWLVQNMGIDSGRIQTKGFGSSKLLVPGNGTIEQQAVNRRVEIVIRTPSTR